MNEIKHIEWLKKTLGPGVLFASTAIGVSHLVQSTRAGASYGFGLLFFIIILIFSQVPIIKIKSKTKNNEKTSC